MFWNAVSCPTRYSVRLYPTKSWFDNDYSVFEMVAGISQRRTASPDDSHRQERANSARVTAKGAKPQESDLSQTVCWVVVVGWNSQLGYIFVVSFARWFERSMKNSCQAVALWGLSKENICLQNRGVIFSYRLSSDGTRCREAQKGFEQRAKTLAKKIDKLKIHT